MWFASWARARGKEAYSSIARSTSESGSRAKENDRDGPGLVPRRCNYSRLNSASDWYDLGASLMRELSGIVRAFEQARLEDKATALASVVSVEGSAYRRPGARMLVTEDGQ